MHNETLASEIIADIQDKRRKIITELECMDTEFEKLLFVLSSAQEIMEDMKEPESLNDGLVQYSNTKNALMLLSIVFDYAINLQTSASDIVNTYYKEICSDKAENCQPEQPKDNKTNYKKMDYKKMIIDMVNQINNEEALEIIHNFVMVPYNRAKLEKDGSNQHGLQKNDC